MFIKYALISCLCIAAVLLLFHNFNEKETILAAKNTHRSASAKRPNIGPVGLRADDDIAAAILILPKSFLPVLKRFSQSTMARNIKILPAQIQIEEGKMMVVPKNQNGNQHKRLIAAGDDFSRNTTKSASAITPGKKEGIATFSLFYLLANAHKNRLYR